MVGNPDDFSAVLECKLQAFFFDRVYEGGYKHSSATDSFPPAPFMSREFLLAEPSAESYHSLIWMFKQAQIPIDTKNLFRGDA